MTDGMDKLLFDIGQRANAEVDFSSTLNLLLKEREKQRKKKAMLLRYCGAAAAALVLLVGVTTLMPKMGKAESEAAPAAEAPMEYALAEASYAADEAMEERMIETETAAEECAPAAAPAEEEAPAPAEEAAGSHFEAPAEEGTPLAPETEEFEEAAAEESANEVFAFEGAYYAAFNPAFTDPADLDKLGLPHSITPDMVGEELGSAVSLGNDEPFPVYACPSVSVPGVLILGGDTYLLPVNLLGEGVQ